jgi:hypothetical protein
MGVIARCRLDWSEGIVRSNNTDPTLSHAGLLACHGVRGTAI